VPEYVFPGVYVEEVSYGSKLIDGVSTFLIGVAIDVLASIALDRLRQRCFRA